MQNQRCIPNNFAALRAPTCWVCLTRSYGTPIMHWWNIRKHQSRDVIENRSLVDFSKGNWHFRWWADRWFLCRSSLLVIWAAGTNIWRYGIRGKLNYCWSWLLEVKINSNFRFLIIFAAKDYMALCVRAWVFAWRENHGLVLVQGISVSTKRTFRGGDLDENCDFQKIQSRVLWYFWNKISINLMNMF